jgi:hypothetical protein
MVCIRYVPTGGYLHVPGHGKGDRDEKGRGARGVVKGPENIPRGPRRGPRGPGAGPGARVPSPVPTTLRDRTTLPRPPAW